MPLLKELSSDVAVLVTADHILPVVKVHIDDPVPVALKFKGIELDAVTKLTEKECMKVPSEP